MATRSPTAKRAKSGQRVVANPNGAVSRVGQETLTAFRAGVHKALGALARRQIATVATINGHRVYGIPKKVNGGYILVPVPKKRPAKSKRSHSRKR